MKGHNSGPGLGQHWLWGLNNTLLLFLILLSRIVSISLSLSPLSSMTYYIYDDNTRDHTSGGRDKAEEVYSNAVQVDTDTDSF